MYKYHDVFLLLVCILFRYQFVLFVYFLIKMQFEASLITIKQQLMKILILISITLVLDLNSLIVHRQSFSDSSIHGQEQLHNEQLHYQQLFHTVQLHGQQSFTGLTLNSTFPKSFIQNQYLKVCGVVKSQYYRQTWIHLILVQNTTAKQHNFRTKQQADHTFSLTFQVPGPGKYSLSMFVGNTGSVLTIFYDVKPMSADTAKKLNSSVPKPTNASLQSRNNKLFLKWSGKICKIAKIVFSQVSPKKIEKTFFYSSQNSQFEVPFIEFKDFKVGQTKFSISCANSTSSSLQGRNSNFSDSYDKAFQSCGHYFSKTYAHQVTISEIKSAIQINQTLYIAGNSLVQLRNDITIERPNKTICHILLDSSFGKGKNIPAKSLLNISLNQFSLEGVYFVQINNLPGSAAINTPVYVGNIYPLIPDFRDLDEDNQIKDKLTDMTISQARQKMLNYINSLRKQWNLKQVYLDNQLNQVAQAHAQDMVKRNYFDHYNLEGLGPQDRAKATGFKGYVGQNLGRDYSIKKCHESLLRSACHLQNIVGPNWSRVGLGLAQKSSGQIYVVEQFSSRDYITYPLTSNEKNVIQDKVRKNFEAVCANSREDKIISNILAVQLKLPYKQRYGTSMSDKLWKLDYTGYKFYVIFGNYDENLVDDTFKSQKEKEKLLVFCNSKYNSFGFGQEIDPDNGYLTITTLLAK